MQFANINRWVFFVAALFMATLANAQSGNVYANGQTYGAVQDATVVQTRQVSVEKTSQRDRLVGLAIGGALGGVIGNKLGSQSRSGRVLASAIGSAAGAYTGHAIANRLSKVEAQELIVQTPNGRLHSVVQPMPAEQFQSGDTVRLVNQGGQVRVINTYQPSYGSWGQH